MIFIKHRPSPLAQERLGGDARHTPTPSDLARHSSPLYEKKIHFVLKLPPTVEITTNPRVDYCAGGFWHFRFGTSGKQLAARGETERKHRGIKITTSYRR